MSQAEKSEENMNAQIDALGVAWENPHIMKFRNSIFSLRYTSIVNLAV